MTRRLLLLCSLASTAACAQQVITLPAGTQLPLTSSAYVPMRAGAPIRAELLYPVYADGNLVLPARTVIAGRIVSLKPDRHRRINARLRADFTPYRTPIVRFDSILPPAADPIPIVTGEATDGAPVFRVVPMPRPKGGIVGQYLAFAQQHVRDTVNGVVGPEKADRLKQFFYSQLPYHPQRVTRGTTWTLETAAPLTLAPVAAPPEPPPPPPPHGFIARFLHPPAPAATGPGPETWDVEAYLDEAISSETSHSAQLIHATVAQPVLNRDGSVAVPQGAVLKGVISQARPSRHLARDGVLRFNFSELQLPGAPPQPVRTTLAAADSSSEAQLALDSEGQVKPKAQDKLFVPALLLVLANQPFDRGHHGDGDGNHLAGKDAAASSGLGLITLIVGAAAQQPNFAIGVGYYSAALSIYPRFLGKGASVAFPRNTRITIRTTPSRSAAIKPTGSQL